MFNKGTTETTLHFSTITFSLKYFYHQNYTRDLLRLGIEPKPQRSFDREQAKPKKHISVIPLNLFLT